LGSPAAFSLLPDQSLLFGTPLTERQVQGDTFFLASDYQDASGLTPMRFAIAGCQAPSPEQVKGQFRRCADGAADLEGTFEAARVKRVDGEAEASGVELVSETALPHGTAMDVFVADGYAYVTALSDGLFIYDVKDPAHPQKVAELVPTNDTWYRSWVKGQTLYISSNNEGLLVYDVSTPSAPKRLDSLPDPSVQGWGLFVDQNTLYMMSPAPQAEVLVFDISTPTAPSLLTRYFVQESLATQGETPVEGVVLNNRLYIGHWRYGLAVADVSKPAAPTTLGHFGYDNATSRAVAAGIIGDRTLAFEASEGWGSLVRALDVSDPAHITEVGRFQMRPESTVMGLTLVGSKLYVAHNQDGLRILDMSNPSTPRQVAYYNTWRETDPGRGRSFLDGLSGVKVPGDGYIYSTETSRGLLVFREQ
ncbi:MAG: LVIVD repeat-containing protein, partial [Archangium sp.]